MIGVVVEIDYSIDWIGINNGEQKLLEFKPLNKMKINKPNKWKLRKPVWATL